MAKDPAFLFYPNDWIGGTMGMTFEEKGAYMELLMMQFNRGHMTSHMIGQTIGQLWVKVQDKFKQDKDGLWFNERLEIEKEKRKNFTESRNNNRFGNNQYTKNRKNGVGHMTNHMTGHMENENENILKGGKGENLNGNGNGHHEPKSFEKQTFSNYDEIIKSTHFERVKEFVYQRTYLNPNSQKDKNLIHEVARKYEGHLMERNLWVSGITAAQFAGGLVKWVLNEKNFSK